MGDRFKDKSLALDQKVPSAERNIRVPLFLDPLPHSNPDGSINFSRFYEGYLKAASRELGQVGRIAIYNTEGRILTIHASGQDIEPTDDIFNFVKSNLGVVAE